MTDPTLSVDALNTQNGLRYEGSENFIDCVEFQNNVNGALGGSGYSSGYPKDAAQFVARHINNALYCEIFGNQAPTQFLLESWIAQQAKTSTDPQIRASYGQHAGSDLFDGRVGANDMDYFFHILSGRAGGPQLQRAEGDDKYDHIAISTMKTLWDPKFGADRAAAELTKTKRDDLKCGPTTHQDAHVLKPQEPERTTPYTYPSRDDRMADEFRKAIEEIEYGKSKNGITIISHGGMHDLEDLGAGGKITKQELEDLFRTFDSAPAKPAPKPAPHPFTRELTHYTTQSGASTATERLRYTITGNAITVEVIGADGTVERTLNVPQPSCPKARSAARKAPLSTPMAAWSPRSPSMPC